MKRSIILLCGIGLVIILFYSCKQDESANPQAVQSSILSKKSYSYNNPYSEVGEAHNALLDSFFIFIKRNLDNIKTKEDFKKYCDLGRIEYSNKNKYINNKIKYDEILSFCKSKRGKEISKSDIVAFGYSDRQAHYFKRLLKIVEVKDLNKKKDSVNSFNYDVAFNLNNEEASPILMSSAVMISSAEYWKKHDISKLINNGKDAKLTNNIIQMEALGPYEIIRADLLGAGGAVIGCIGASIGYGPCVAGVALATSCAEAALEMFEWLATQDLGGAATVGAAIGVWIGANWPNGI